MRRYMLATLLAAGTSCARDAAQQASSASQAPIAEVELTIEQERPVARADAGLDSAAAVRRLAELQVVADSASTEAAAAPALLRAALLKIRLYATDIEGALAKTRPQDFFHNEIAGGWLYTGVDLDTLLARYPRSALADDARYAKLFLIPGGECEGRVECSIGWGLEPHMEFLRTDGSSPHAAAVVATINDRLRQALGGIRDLRVATEDYDPAAVRAHLARYDSIARRMPRPVADSATVLLDAYWRLFEKGPAAPVHPDRLEPGEIPAAVSAACDTATVVLREAFSTSVKREEGAFEFWQGRGTGCILTGKGSYKALNGLEHEQKIGEAFKPHGWIAETEYQASGPDGAAQGFRKGDMLCIASFSWPGHDDSDTTQHVPTPEDDLFEVVVKCAKEASARGESRGPR